MNRSQHKAIEDRIRELDAAWGEAATKKDLEKTVSFYAPDGSLVWPSQEAIHGTQAIRDAWREMMKIPGLGLRFTPERIDVSGDLAVDFGRVDLKQDTDQGPKEEVDKYLVVWQLIDGDWKVLYDSYNANAAS